MSVLHYNIGIVDSDTDSVEVYRIVHGVLGPDGVGTALKTLDKDD